VDELYAAPADGFVAARDELARRLRAAGDRDASAAVKRLRRPSLVASALNQVARQHADDVAALLDAGEAVGTAQAAAVTEGDRGGLRDAARRRRELVGELARRVSALAGAAHHDEAVATLEAASIDPEVGRLLRRGRLTKEVPAPAVFGFGAIPDDVEADDASGGGTAPTPPAPADTARHRREVARAERAVAEADDAVARAGSDLEEASAAVEAATARLAAARSERDAAVGARDELTSS
jgi:hypothetical protein